MVVRLRYLNASGKQEGKGMILHDDELRFLKTSTTAKRGVLLIIDNEDEFGNVTEFQIEFDPLDIKQLIDSL